MTEPAVTPKFRVHNDPEALALAVAQRFVELAELTIRRQGAFHVALAGGTTPKRVYELLAAPPLATAVAWDKVHIWFGDERCVPADHPDSNYRMANETLLSKVAIPSDNVHRVPTEESDPEVAARRYGIELSMYMPSRIGYVVLDLIMLGLGEDGHTASLFPGTAILNERKKIVNAVFVAHLNSWRISLTLPAINHSYHVLFTVTGAAKADIVHKLFCEPRPNPAYPAQLVTAQTGLEWYLDHAAAQHLPASLLQG